MKSIDKMKTSVYELLDWIETERPWNIRLFWTCVFKDIMMTQYPTLKRLRDSLFDGQNPALDIVKGAWPGPGFEVRGGLWLSVGGFSFVGGRWGGVGVVARPAYAPMQGRGEIIFQRWPGNALGFPCQSWSMWPGKGKSGAPCLTPCSNPDKRLRMRRMRMVHFTVFLDLK